MKLLTLAVLAVLVVILTSCNTSDKCKPVHHRDKQGQEYAVTLNCPVHVAGIRG